MIDDEMKFIIELSVNSQGQFEDWPTLKDGVLMPEVIRDMSANSAKAHTSSNDSRGTRKKKRKLQVCSQTNQV